MRYQIRNKQELEIAYEIKMIVEEHLAAGRDKQERLKELKKAIREYNKQERDRWIIHDDGIDGYTELILLPEKVQTMEQAVRWFMDYEYSECIPSMYDCTGQRFTWFYRVVERRGRWYVYHSVGFDV